MIDICGGNSMRSAKLNGVWHNVELETNGNIIIESRRKSQELFIIYSNDLKELLEMLLFCYKHTNDEAKF